MCSSYHDEKFQRFCQCHRAQLPSKGVMGCFVRYGEAELRDKVKAIKLISFLIELFVLNYFPAPREWRKTGVYSEQELRSVDFF